MKAVDLRAIVTEAEYFYWRARESVNDGENQKAIHILHRAATPAPCNIHSLIEDR
jgi:hypothetical protein